MFFFSGKVTHSGIKAAVKKIIRQVAEVAAGGSVKQIGMGDLPDL
jgi:hypothetical protein